MEAYFPFTSSSWELEVYWQVSWLELLGSGVVQQSLPKSAGLSTIPHPLPPPLNRSPSSPACPEKSAGASASSSSESPCFYSESRTSTSSGPLTSASWSNSRKGRFSDSSRFQNSGLIIRTLLFSYLARAVPLGVRYRFMGTHDGDCWKCCGRSRGGCEIGI